MNDKLKRKILEKHLELEKMFNEIKWKRRADRIPIFVISTLLLLGLVRKIIGA